MLIFLNLSVYIYQMTLLKSFHKELYSPIFHHYIFFLLCYNQPQWLLFLMFRLSQTWSVVVPSSWLLSPDITLSVFKRYLALFFGEFFVPPQKKIQAYFTLPLLQTWNQPFLQASLVTFSGKWHLETKMWIRSMVTAGEYKVKHWDLFKSLVFFTNILTYIKGLFLISWNKSIKKCIILKAWAYLIIKLFSDRKVLELKRFFKWQQLWKKYKIGGKGLGKDEMLIWWVECLIIQHLYITLQKKIPTICVKKKKKAALYMKPPKSNYSLDLVWV